MKELRFEGDEKKDKANLKKAWGIFWRGAQRLLWRECNPILRSWPFRWRGSFYSTRA